MDCPWLSDNFEICSSDFLSLIISRTALGIPKIVVGIPMITIGIPMSILGIPMLVLRCPSNLFDFLRIPSDFLRSHIHVYSFGMGIYSVDGVVEVCNKLGDYPA